MSPPHSRGKISGAGVPDWKEVTEFVHVNYDDIFFRVDHHKGIEKLEGWDGPSDPLRFLYPLFYSKKTRIILDEASYSHDAGYFMLRLPGSPYVDVRRAGWDTMYRNGIRDMGRTRKAFGARVVAHRFHHRGLIWFGGKGWKSNARIMEARGYTSIGVWAYLRRREQAAESSPSV